MEPKIVDPIARLRVTLLEVGADWPLRAQFHIALQSDRAALTWKHMRSLDRPEQLAG